MNIRGAIIAAGLGLAAVVSVQGQGQVPDAASVLAKAREALGGEKKLSAIKSLVATGQTRQIRGENLVPIEFEINIEMPDKYSRRDETPAVESGYTTTGFNGDGLIQLPPPAVPPSMPMAARPGGPPPPTPEQMAAQLAAQRKTRVASIKQDFARLTLGMFAASFPSYPLTFTRIGTAESPQGKADVIEAKGPDNFVARLLINQETHLPVMLSWTGPAGRGIPAGRPGGAPAPGGMAMPPGAAAPPAAGAAPPPAAPPAAGAPATPGAPGRAGAPPAAAPAPPENRLYYADYRDVDGVQLPFRLRRATGADTTEETTFDKYKINAKIDPKKFEVVK